eukprot:1178492-Prorocentrum_minimum.AAC.1
MNITRAAKWMVFFRFEVRSSNFSRMLGGGQVSDVERAEMVELRRTLDERDRRLSELQGRAQSLERANQEAEARADISIREMEELRRKLGAMAAIEVHSHAPLLARNPRFGTCARMKKRRLDGFV